MGPVLTQTWLAGADEDIAILDEASVSQVREAVRRRGGELGLGVEAYEALAAAASELAFNQLRHARLGRVGLRALARAGVPGLEVIAADAGNGIAEPARALRGELATVSSGATGLGIGLSAAHRLADELDVDVRAGEGTCVRARKFVAPPPRSEVAVLGRVCAGERRSGDQALVVRRDDALVLALVDGLGHGEPAREAADAAVVAIEAGIAGGAGPDGLLLACERALERTRGAVAAIVRVHGGVLQHAGAGNVTVRVYRAGTPVTFLSAARVLGARQHAVRPASETLALAGEATLVMFTDGLSSRADVAGQPALLRQPPVAIAEELLTRFGRPDDDATVVVARLR